MRVQILEEAAADLADGFQFYERQAEGLREYFLDSLWSDILSLRVYGGVHDVQYGYFRLLAKRFPYAVYYRIENNTARIRTVLDCRRDPNRISERRK